MADELEEVTQRFVADLSDYLEPIEEAADETEGFADVVEQAKENLGGLRDAGAETGEGMGALAASEDDATASTEALSESVGSLRDKVYEMYPGIDEATAALLAEASAAQAAGLELDEYGASADAASAQGDGLAATLISLRSILGAADVGDSLTVGVAGMNQFLIETGEDAEKAGTGFTGLRTEASLLDDAMLKSANSTRDFWEAVNALDPALAHSEDIGRDASKMLRDLGATENEAAAGANALVKAQRDWDAAGGGGKGGIFGAIAQFFGSSGEGGFSAGGVAGNAGSLGAGEGIAAAIAAAAVGITGLVSGIGASIIGVGSFVALAIPGFEKVKDAIHDTSKELAKLSPDERGAVLGIRDLESEYKSMAKAFEPDAFRVFNSGLKVAKDILPGLKEPAEVTAGVLSKLLGQLDQMLSPKYAEVFSGEHGFMGMKTIMTSDPLKQFDSIIDPYIKTALPAFAHGLGDVGVAFEHLLTTMSAKDVGDDIRDFFGVVSFSLDKVAELVEHTMNAWDDLHRAFVNTRQWTGDAATDFQNLESFAESAWISLVTIVLHEVVRLARDTEKEWDDLRHTTAADFDGLAGDVTGAVRRLVDETIADWDYLARSTERDWDDVVTFVESIPGRIEHIFAGSGHWLWQAGVNFVEGLIGGVKSMIGDLLGTIGNMASGAIGAAEHFLGIGSPSKITEQHGLWLMEGYEVGIRKGAPGVESALRSALGGIPGMFPGSAGSGSSSAPSVHVTVPVTLTPGTQGFNDPAFLQYLQREVQEAVLRYQMLNPHSGLTRIVPGIRA